MEKTALDVYKCFIPNHQNLQATKMSFCRWMGNKQTVVQPNNGILLVQKEMIHTELGKDTVEI